MHSNDTRTNFFHLSSQNNLWPLGKLGLKQLDLDVFLYSDLFDAWSSITAIIIFWQVYDLLVSVIKLAQEGFQIQEMGIGLTLRKIFNA